MVIESDRRFDPAPSWRAALEPQILNERARMRPSILQRMGDLGVRLL
jgi:hypothetical protein